MKLIFSCILLLSSCSLFAPKKQIVEKEFDKMNLNELNDHFIQKSFTGGGVINSTVKPLTKEIIKEEILSDYSYLRPGLVEQKIKEKISSFATNRTCFEITLNSERSDLEKVTDFNNWSAMVLGPSKKESYLTFEKASLQNTPEEYKGTSYYGKTPFYRNNAIACTDEIISMEKGFEVILTLNSELTPWPFDSFINHYWPVHEFREINGEKRFISKPTREKQKYRGW